MITPDSTIPQLEREHLYLLNKADFISDFLNFENGDIPVTVTLSYNGGVGIEFMVSDLFGTDLGKSMLAKLEELFRQKADHVRQRMVEIRKARKEIRCTDG